MAAICAINERIDLALWLAAMAVLIDQVDGVVARRLNKVTLVGGYLDTFSDFACYCVFPTALVYTVTGPHEAVSIFTVLLLLLLACGALRLAYYLESQQKDIVVGIPCVVLLILFPWLDLLGKTLQPTACWCFVLGALIYWCSAAKTSLYSLTGKVLFVGFLTSTALSSLRLFN